MTITQDSSAPLVIVVGATGVQGGSVVKALAESDKQHRIRGFTRDAGTKAAAEALKKRGVEIVQISLVVDNVEEVYKAFTGANMVFEIPEGKMLIDAAKAAGIERIVWSGLTSPKKVSNGKLTHVQHFDGKSVVTEYGRQSGVPFVNVQAGFYARNFLGNPTILSKQPDGTFAIAWAVKPTMVLPVIDATNDYGLFVRRVLESPVFPDGSDIYTASEDITMEEMARQLSEGIQSFLIALTGKKVVFKQLTTEEWGKTFAAIGAPPPISAQVMEGFTFFDEFGYYGGQPSTSREGLARPTRSWAEFAKHADWSKALV
ncbi:NAD(P)-binding protein [Mycena galericulata]|nr:NAD(P)-binding protein [Mycena galericulata]